ncbi:hypothetical protein BW731_06265 [Vagococcus martis]|uniref:IrrE N-terminal-like domain-containing protein n=1 Tax=Vagococcus martis TaxID=1768210 RepID=A0A1V4DHT5_9ENTE|nr:hypothetical protein [Vagococcus martis]OPF87810.1 hypothetical protein BW731_06265 [Vagococcus martis]
MLERDYVIPILNKWTDILRLKNQWDLDIIPVDDEAFDKTGDIKIDITDKKALVYLNQRNPRNENIEEVIVHELLHLKLYPLDQLTETLINNHYDDTSSEYQVMYEQFMISLETTVEELTKCFLEKTGDDTRLSFGRVKEMKSFNELFEGLNNLE